MSRRVSGWSYFDSSEVLLSTEPCTWAVTSLVSPRCHAYTFISSNDRFVLAPWVIISSLPVTRETQPIPISIRCGSGVSDPEMFGLWEVSWVLHTPHWRHGGTHLLPWQHEWLVLSCLTWAKSEPEMWCSKHLYSTTCLSSLSILLERGCKNYGKGPGGIFFYIIMYQHEAKF